VLIQYGNAKRSFYRALNAMLGKVGHCASEEVTVQLMKLKCLPVLFYGLESCLLNKSQTRSLDYAINSAFSKIFCNKLRDAIDSCYSNISASLTACLKGREHFCINTLVLVASYVVCMLAQLPMTVISSSHFSFVIVPVIKLFS